MAKMSFISHGHTREWVGSLLLLLKRACLHLFIEPILIYTLLTDNEIWRISGANRDSFVKHGMAFTIGVISCPCEPINQMMELSEMGQKLHRRYSFLSQM